MGVARGQCCSHGSTNGSALALIAVMADEGDLGQLAELLELRSATCIAAVVDQEHVHQAGAHAMHDRGNGPLMVVDGNHHARREGGRIASSHEHSRCSTSTRSLTVRTARKSSTVTFLPVNWRISSMRSTTSMLSISRSSSK